MSWTCDSPEAPAEMSIQDAVEGTKEIKTRMSQQKTAHETCRQGRVMAIFPNQPANEPASISMK